MEAKEVKEIFALRLCQYAQMYRENDAALKRLNDADVEDDSKQLSKYTPSRTELSAQRHEILGLVHGYCIAVDDFMGRDSHGMTECLFWDAYDDKKDIPPRMDGDEEDSDTGVQTAISVRQDVAAYKAFEKILFEN